MSNIDLHQSSRKYPKDWKMPPHSEQVEMAIIGCCITTPKQSVPEAQSVITSPEYFYTMTCRSAWEIIQNMDTDKIDAVTIFIKVERLGLSAQFLSDCQSMVTSPEMMPVWLEELASKFEARQVIKTADELTRLAYEGSEAILDEAERKIMAIRPNRTVAPDMRTLIGFAIEKIDRKFQTNEISGLTTGLIDLDRMTDGMHSGEMIVIACYPGTGKSTLAVNIAVTNALMGNPTVIFTAEMAPVQLVLRSLCSESKSNFHRLNPYDLVRMAGVAGKLAKAPLYIEPAAGMNVRQIAAILRRMKQKHGIKLAVGDYIQRFSGNGETRELEIASISREIKNVALDLGIPFLALSQLNDDGKLRESRALGQDGDSVWKLMNDGDWHPVVQPVKLLIEKCRDGSTGSVDLVFQKTFTKFENAAKVSQSDVPGNED
jgi:replicative DNA helicase